MDVRATLDFLLAILGVVLQAFRIVPPQGNSSDDDGGTVTGAVVVTFGVTSDGPYDDEGSNMLRDQIRQSIREQSSSFTVHLGNSNNNKNNNNINPKILLRTPQQQAPTPSEEEQPPSPLCDPSAHAQFRDQLFHSGDRGGNITNATRPIFIVPGRLDWNDCANPDAAWTSWKENFLYFDRQWVATDVSDEREFLVLRKFEQRENWAFLQRDGALFVGVHVLDGFVPSGAAEFKKKRNAYNYDWITGLIMTHQKTIRAVVMFGNAGPGGDHLINNSDFFDPLEEFWRANGTTNHATNNNITNLGTVRPLPPVLYVHASLSTDDDDNEKAAATTPLLYHPFPNLTNFWAVGVANNPIGGNSTGTVSSSSLLSIISVVESDESGDAPFLFSLQRLMKS
jgi:hypothetical protein